MKASLIKIGNSQGVRLPKPVIDQCGLEGEVELEVRNQEVVIRPAKTRRSGWEKAFKTMASQGDDTILDSPATEWEEGEWEWK